MSPRENIIRQVVQRAAGRCEYCGMFQSLQGATFHVEHIIPRTRGGQFSPESLALACPSCNLYKADRTHAVDPQTGEDVPLFHPRTDFWDRYFDRIRYEIKGKTPTGRATEHLLRLNHPRRLQIRRAEELLGLLPPGESGSNR